MKAVPDLITTTVPYVHRPETETYMVFYLVYLMVHCVAGQCAVLAVTELEE